MFLPVSTKLNFNKLCPKRRGVLIVSYLRNELY